jgi:hypothetical protein
MKKILSFGFTTLTLSLIAIIGLAGTAFAQTATQTPPTQAATQTPPAQTLSIPEDNEGFTMVPANFSEKNNYKFNFELKPGQTGENYVAIKNYSNQPADFLLYAANSTLSNQGTIAYKTRYEMGSGTADWVKFESPTITLKALETKIIKFTVTVPANAKMGDYKFGIAMEKQKKDTNNASVTIASRLILHGTLKVTETPKVIAKTAQPNVEIKTVTPLWKTYYFWISFVLFIISLGLLVWSTLHERKKPKAAAHAKQSGHAAKSAPAHPARPKPPAKRPARKPAPRPAPAAPRKPTKR